MAPKIPNLTMEGGQIIFRNLEGKATKYNAAGNRNFCLLLDDESAENMLQVGWNVKYLKPREEGDLPKPYLSVKVNYRGEAGDPRVLLLTSRGRTILTPEVVGLVDVLDIEYVDVTVSPYRWDVNGKTGITAYLQTAYVKIREDPLDLKYQDVEEVTMDGKALASSQQLPELESGPEHVVLEGEWEPTH